MVQSAPALTKIVRRLVLLGLAILVVVVLYPSIVFVASAFLPLSRVLHHAAFVDISTVDGTGAHDVIIDAHNHPDLIASLKASTMISTTPHARPDCAVVIIVDTNIVHGYRYGYFPATGEMGRGNEWCQTPPKFQAWMRTLKPLPFSTDPTSSPGSTDPIVISVPRPKAK